MKEDFSWDSILSLGLLLAFVYAAIFLIRYFFGFDFGRAWVSVWGLLCIAVSLRLMYTREIAVGIDGRPSSYVVRGTWAFLIALLILAVGVVTLFRSATLSQVIN
jgi:hypothetical protein